MIVICINEGGYHLTKNKKYDVFDSSYQEFQYVITNDIGTKHNIEKNLFITLEEYRDLKLKDIFG
jgi:hypothetical protein